MMKSNLIKIFKGDSKEELSETFEHYFDAQLIKVEETTLTVDCNFNIKELFNHFSSSEQIISSLYDDDSHELLYLLISLLIDNNIDDLDFHVDGYNLMDEYIEGLDDEEKELLNMDYHYMTDVNVYEIETKNFRYRFKYCGGENY